MGCNPGLQNANLTPKSSAQPLPGEEIVPSNEPVVTPKATKKVRWVVKVPVASANRPVPPVMVPVSVVLRTPGAISVAVPVTSIVTVSPLAAVKV